MKGLRALSGVLKGNGLKARAARGSFFTIMVFGSQNALRLLSNLILTRLLFPEAFGLMAIVFTVQTGVSMMADLGTRVSIIQHKDGDKPEFLNTAWVLQIIRGGLIALIIWLFAKPIAGFYGYDILAEILIYIGFAVIIQGFMSTKLPLSERNLQLGRVAVVQISAQVTGLIITVILAAWLRSVWALVYGYLINEIVLVTLSHLILKGPANKFSFNRAYAWQIINFGVFILLSSLAGFLISQGDRVILGKIATLEELAFYNIGYFLAAVPLLLARALTDRIIFPLYTQRPPREGENNRQNIFKIRRLITAGCFFGLIVLALIGVSLVELLYDPRFEPAGDFVALLSMALMPTAITLSYAALALAAGDSKRFAMITATSAGIQTISMLYFGSWLGVGGVILGLALGPVLFYPILQVLVRPYRGWDILHDVGFAALVIIFVTIEYQRGAFSGFF